MAIDLSALNKFTRDGKQKDTPKAPPQKPKKSKPFQFGSGNDKPKNKNEKGGFGKGGVHIGGAPKAPTGTATAPYNFVSLPAKALPSPLNEKRNIFKESNDDKKIKSAFADYIASTDQLAGSIEFEIEALTPLFIGGAGEQSFSPAGKPIIPGSTIRGMVKKLLKIVSCGSWEADEDTNDKHPYFRCLMAPKSAPAWMADLHDVYTRRMTSNDTTNGETAKNTKAGFLAEDKDGKYFIFPALEQPKKMLIREYETKFHTQIPKNIKKAPSISWRDDTAYIITGSQSDDKLANDFDEYKRLLEAKDNKIGKQFVRYICLRHADWSLRHSVPDKVVQDYIDDKKRNGVDLLQNGILKAAQVKKMGYPIPADIKSVVPCCYIIENGKVSAFGHGESFRIPYKHSIMDAVPDGLKDTIDFADAIFGQAALWGSRIYFDDAEPVGKTSAEETDWLHPLLGPNPTSYQLYLKQTPGKPLIHWEKNNIRLRGYKLYWHNAQPDWKAKRDEQNEKITHKAAPLSKGSRFTAKIQFKDLSKEELGALLTVFDMRGHKNIAYKLGQGKSLGFGSIRLNNLTLYVNKPVEAYGSLFHAGKLDYPTEKTPQEEFITAFQAYIQKNNLKSEWDKVMEELTAMLDWSNTQKSDWGSLIKSMSGNVQTGEVDKRFINRTPLPTILEVTQKAK